MTLRRCPPRILYVSHTLPRKGDFGGELRCLNVARALREVGTVEVVLLDDENQKDSLNGEAECEFPLLDVLDVQPQTNSGFVGKLRWSFDPTIDYPHGCGVKRDALCRLLRMIKDFDLVWFFRLRAPDMFPNAAWPCSVVDIDDLPSTYERASLHAGGGLTSRLLALRRLYSWRRREKLLGARFGVLTVCSEEDRCYLGQMGVTSVVHVIPNGFDRPRSEPVRSVATPPRIGFIGLFDFFPNREGISWFIGNCWPRIKREIPDARLRLVGRDSHGFLTTVGPDIDKLGWLANPSEEIKTWSVMIIPIRVGAGTRIKIAQGFSERCPIVSTAFGACGYGAVDGQQMFLADSATAFSNACISAIRDPEYAKQIAERGWHEFVEKWTWDAIRPRVWAAAEDCMRTTANNRVEVKSNRM
jgi:glycosyltransferase involved in cell wall biosynthesis